MAFDLGKAYEGTKAAEDRPPQLIPRSKDKTAKGPDGKYHTTYSPLYLLRFARPGEQGERFGRPNLSLRLVTAGRILGTDSDGSNPRHFSVFDDISQFLSDAEIQAEVMADETVADEDKEARIAARLKGAQLDKRRVLSLLDAIKPHTLASLEEPEIEGFEVAAAIGIRKWDGGSANTVVKYFPASKATAALPDADSDGDDV